LVWFYHSDLDPLVLPPMKKFAFVYAANEFDAVFLSFRPGYIKLDFEFVLVWLDYSFLISVCNLGISILFMEFLVSPILILAPIEPVARIHAFDRRLGVECSTVGSVFIFLVAAIWFHIWAFISLLFNLVLIFYHFLGIFITL
jgi:hypothetical protein